MGERRGEEDIARLNRLSRIVLGKPLRRLRGMWAMRNYAAGSLGVLVARIWLRIPVGPEAPNRLGYAPRGLVPRD